ncbi:MAG: ACT domain-containing protein [Oscillospiraceae bacterium]
MSDKQQLVLVDAKVLPEVFKKVLLAKTYISKDTAKSSTDACKLADLSRSAFYKYKDSIYFYEEKDFKKTLTLYLRLSDEPGVLSSVLSKLYEIKANILTVNQNIAVNRVAVVTISFLLDDNSFDIEPVLERIAQINGVVRVKKI